MTPCSPRLLLFGWVALAGCSRPASTPPKPTPPGTPPAAEVPSSETPQPPAENSAAPTTEATLLGEWVGEESCVPQMAGMENADEATIQAVGAQIAANRFTFSDDTMTHEVGSNKAEQPYKVLEHEGMSWTIEMNGPTGQPQRTELNVSGSSLRMTRDGVLVICLRRPDGPSDRSENQ